MEPLAPNQPPANAVATEEGRLPLPWLLVFLASFCLMMVEVVSGRMLAPYLGVSIYTWTSVIGVTLAGIAFGNYLGGQLADRQGTKMNLGLCLAAAGVTTLLANYLAPELGSIMGGTGGLMPLWLKTTLFSIGVFFPTATFLSMVPPQIIKFDMRRLGSAGTTIGTIGAWSAFGSIVGTFAAGYWLIGVLGTKLLFTCISILLMGLGLLVARPKQPIWKNKIALLILLFLVGDFFRPGFCQVETNYYCIRVLEKNEAEAKSYTLKLDHLVHSFVYPKEPARLGYGYEEVYTNLIAYQQEPEAAFSTLFIGGGGYTLPRYLETYYPKADMMVAEIDPGVTDVNHRFMELPTSTRIQTQNGDARVFLNRLPENQAYDLVFGDAFNDFSVPYHLTTVEFHRLLKSHMSDKGVYAMNIIDDARYGSFLASMLRTLRSVWTHVYVAPIATEINPGRNTIVLLATDQPIDRDKWYDTESMSRLMWGKDEDISELQVWLLEDQKIEAFLAGHDAPALTDDFAPTDRYLAPVFIDAF